MLTLQLSLLDVSRSCVFIHAEHDAGTLGWYMLSENFTFVRTRRAAVALNYSIQQT